MERLQGVNGRNETFSVSVVAVNEVKKAHLALPVIRNRYRWMTYSAFHGLHGSGNVIRIGYASSGDDALIRIVSDWRA